MAELSYSFHLGRDKNRRTSSRSNAKNNLSGSTSLANNGIQNARQLSKVNNHDFRKYDDDTRGIYTLKGCNDIVYDVKEFYKTEFEEARLEYNNKQSRPSRMINDYFEHVSNDEKKDLACEIIIELGNKEFWDEKNIEEKKKMVEVYNEQVLELERLVPEFKITNAVVHLDETSPHMHIVGVPVKYNCKTGMKMQVGKSDVFTKDRLTKIQDKMREKCIDSFNKYYKEEATLKEKQKGRNRDIHVSQMYNYQELKKELEIKKDSIDKNTEKIKSINNSSKELKDIVSNLDGNRFGGYKLNDKQKDRLEKLLKDVEDMTNYFDNYRNIIDSLSTINNDLEYQRNRNNKLEKIKDDLIKSNKTWEQDFIDQYDSTELLEQILKGRKDKHLELVTYIAENVNSRDSIKSNTFKKIANDLKDKRIINEDEHKVIFKPPRNINKGEINRALKSLNQQMEEAAEEFYQTNKKDDYEL